MGAIPPDFLAFFPKSIVTDGFVCLSIAYDRSTVELPTFYSELVDLFFSILSGVFDYLRELAVFISYIFGPFIHVFITPDFLPNAAY